MKKILIILLSIVALLFIISVFLPKKGKVERSLTIKAPIDTVYEKLNNIKRWKEWTIWFVQDPNAKVEFTGPEFGPVATLKWEGNDGKGKIIIIETVKPTTVNYVMRINNYAPFYGYFDLNPNPDSSLTITWKITLDAGNNPMKKYFCLFMDQFMGKDMEQSLEKLK